MQGACISDTLFQVLLTTQCLEEPLAELLLEKFVEVCNEGDNPLVAEDAVEVPLHEQPLSQLLLAQLQVLDNGNCSHKISNLMIEAFESLPPPMQAQICTIVGEAVPPDKVEGASLAVFWVIAICRPQYPMLHSLSKLHGAMSFCGRFMDVHIVRH